MPYPTPTPEELSRFSEDGFLVVRNAIDAQELHALVQMGEELIRSPPDPKANDWDWRRGEPLEKRVWRIVQSGVDSKYPVDRDVALSLMGRSLRRTPDASGDGVLVRAVPGQAAGHRGADPVAPGRRLLGPHAVGSRHHVLDGFSFGGPGKRLHAFRSRRTPVPAGTSQSAGDGQRPARLRNSSKMPK